MFAHNEDYPVLFENYAIKSPALTLRFLFNFILVTNTSSAPESVATYIFYILYTEVIWMSILLQYIYVSDHWGREYSGGARRFMTATQS